MKMTIDYQIVHTKGLIDLRSAVMTFLNKREGWEPTGTIYGSSLGYYQVLTRFIDL